MGTSAALFAASSTLQAGAQIGAGVSQRRTAEQNARLLRDRGEAALRQGRLRARSLVAEQRAAFGAANVFGVTPTAVMINSAAELELEALRAQFSFMAEASARETAGNAALTRGLVQSSGTILGRAFQASNLFPRSSRTQGALAPPDPFAGLGSDELMPLLQEAGLL